MANEKIVITHACPRKGHRGSQGEASGIVARQRSKDNSQTRAFTVRFECRNKLGKVCKLIELGMEEFVSFSGI